jgi:hypothetical protein
LTQLNPAPDLNMQAIAFDNCIELIPQHSRQQMCGFLKGLLLMCRARITACDHR